jgi:precorrin-6B methylase 1
MRVSATIAAILVVVGLIATGAYFWRGGKRDVESISVAVFSDHYEIAGARFEGSLAALLDRYADPDRMVSILFSGDPAVVNARVSEERQHIGRRNVRLVWIAPPEYHRDP